MRQKRDEDELTYPLMADSSAIVSSEGAIDGGFGSRAIASRVGVLAITAIDDSCDSESSCSPDLDKHRWLPGPGAKEDNVSTAQMPAQ
jgi:hypothetical protein